MADRKFVDFDETAAPLTRRELERLGGVRGSSEQVGGYPPFIVHWTIVILAIGAIWAFWPAASAYAKNLQRQLWPVSECVIIGHKVEQRKATHRSSRASGGQGYNYDVVTAYLEILFIYSVDGQLFQGKAVSDDFSKRSKALDFALETYPLGSSHQIHYDPDLDEGAWLPNVGSVPFWVRLTVFLLVYFSILYSVRLSIGDHAKILTLFGLALGIGLIAGFGPKLEADKRLSETQDTRALAGDMAEIQPGGPNAQLQTGMSPQEVANKLGAPLAVEVRDNGQLLLTGGPRGRMIAFKKEQPDAPFLSISTPDLNR